MTFLRHRTALFLLVVAALWLGWEAFLTVTAPGRIDPGLAAALGGEEPVNIAVSLGFPPEDFHVRLFQEYGVVGGVSGTTVRLSRVSVRDVHQIARYYWVRRISPQ